MRDREFAQPEQREIDREINTDERLSTADMVAAAQRRPVREDEPLEQTPSSQLSGKTTDWAEGAAPLFDKSKAEEFRSRWAGIQAGFVDEPRGAVEQADELVAETMKHLAGIFAEERENLEREWAKGEDVSTEDLRIALQRYRSFFDRLLSV